MAAVTGGSRFSGVCSALLELGHAFVGTLWLRIDEQRDIDGGRRGDTAGNEEGERK